MKLKKLCRNWTTGWSSRKLIRRGSLDSLKIHALAELLLTTKKDSYKQELYRLGAAVEKHFRNSGWTLGRVLPLPENQEFLAHVTAAAQAYQPNG